MSYERKNKMIAKNDVEITITSQVEQKEAHTINTITRDIIDLGIRKKGLQVELKNIDVKIVELEDIKKEVSEKLLEI